MRDKLDRIERAAKIPAGLGRAELRDWLLERGGTEELGTWLNEMSEQVRSE